MTSESRYIARILFINRLLKSNEQAFQGLFWSIMKARHGQDFIEVRPQGRKGDGGNDGYLPPSGHYFQVYGPVEPADTVIKAAEKLSVDFQKLLKHWDKVTPLKLYSFVYNDKYEGTFKTIAQALGALEKQNPKIGCRLFTAADLENEFMELTEDEMQRVLNTLLPDPRHVVGVNYSVLKEVIDKIMLAPAGMVPTRFGDLPQLNDKILLNNLCTAWADTIRRGARLAGHVDSYFRKNSTFLKQSLRDHLISVYQKCRDEGRAIVTLPSGVSRDDLIFQRLREELLPAHANRATEDAVEIIIGYYFEACDIFDPHAKKDAPNASA